MKRLIPSSITFALLIALQAGAQTFNHSATTEKQPWQKQAAVRLQTKAQSQPALEVTDKAQGHVFRHWGTCFNELDLDAIMLLKPDERERIMHDLFAPDGDLHFTRGRLSMNANDYSRAWYSCDTVAGDFQLKHFNIEHDKQNVIRLIKMAQRWQPQLTFWVSPWSPPAWMKINQDYPVRSSQWNRQPKEKDYLLFDDGGMPATIEMQTAQGQAPHLFPRRLAAQTYFIQDPRYLQAYANMFCRFIDLYAEEGIPINMVMYQNEAYSYTPYPGCAWTADGTLRFNRDYLIPIMRQRHPEVDVCIGTLNTNRLDYVKHFIDGLKDQVKGVGLQWEGRQIIDSLRQRYPHLHIIQSESECGNGQMDWKAGEHTFFLLNEYIGRGCDEYFIWNFILADQGSSSWGWKQNALIQVRSADNTYRYTPEYYAVKHFSHFVEPGSQVLAFTPRTEETGTQAIVFRRTDGKRVVVCGNTSASPLPMTVKLGNRFMNISLAPHSFHTFVEK